MFEERIDNIMGIAYAMDMLEYVGKVSLCFPFLELIYAMVFFLKT